MTDRMNERAPQALAHGVLAAVDAAQATRRRWVQLLETLVAQLYAKPRTESTLKYAGGVIAALVAIKYSRSFTSAGFIGVFSGILAHSIYADVLKKAKNRASRPPRSLIEQHEEQRERLHGSDDDDNEGDHDGDRSDTRSTSRQ